MDGPPMHTATTINNTVDPGASSNNRVTQTQTPPPSIPNSTHRLQQRQRQQTSVYTSPSSRTVRTNWIAFMRLSWQRISRTSKVIIGITSIISMAEIVITIVMLILGRGEQCDKPLDMYLIVFVIRLGFSMPLTLYQHLWPSGYNADIVEPAGTESASSTTASRSIETTAAIRDGRSSTTTSTSPSHTDQTTTESTDHTPSHSAEPAPRQQQQEQQQENSNRASVSRSWIDRVKSFLDLVSILWFIVGNYFIFTASAQCHHDAKYLFYTTMTWILLGYFLVLIPLLLCAVVIFCLPCLIVAMRTMNIDYTTGMVGANKTEIQSIPIYKFRSAAASSREHGPASSPTPSASPSTPPAPPKPKKHGIMVLFPSRTSNHQDTDEEVAFDDWTTDPEDASCTICLSDYEDGDLICNLRCNHHFHKDCVCEWLALNFKCPLCQRDFRRGRADEEDEDKTDSDHST